MSATTDKAYGQTTVQNKHNAEEVSADGSEVTGENAGNKSSAKEPTQHRVADILKDKLGEEKKEDVNNHTDYCPRQTYYSSRLLSPTAGKMVNGSAAVTPDDMTSRHPLESLESSQVLRGILQSGERIFSNGDQSPRNYSENNNDNRSLPKYLKQEREREERVYNSCDVSYNGRDLDEGSSIPSHSPNNLQFTDDSDQEKSYMEHHINYDDEMYDDDHQLGDEEDVCLQNSDDEYDDDDDDDVGNPKRERVETIVCSMKNSPNKVSPDSGIHSSEVKRPKRKQYIPQQHGGLDEPSAKKPCSEQDKDIQIQMKHMQEQLSVMQQRYTQLLVNASSGSDLFVSTENGGRKFETDGHDSEKGALRKDIENMVNSKLSAGNFGGLNHQLSPTGGSTPGELDSLAKLLKSELACSMGTLVDSVLAKFVETQKGTKIPEPKTSQIKPLSPPIENKKSPSPVPENVTSSAVKDKMQKSPLINKNNRPMPPFCPVNNNNSANGALKSPLMYDAMDPHGLSNNKPLRTKVTDKYCHPLFEAHLKALADLPRPPHLPLFPTPYFPPSLHHVPPPMYGKEPEQTEALPLIVNTPKKKRTKVTDTRLSPRAARALLQDGFSGHLHPQQPPSHHHPHHHHHHAGDFPQHQKHRHSSTPLGTLSSDDVPMGAFHAPPPPPLVPASLPTSVAIPNPSLQHSEVLAMYSHGDHHMFPEGRPLRGPAHSPTGSPGMMTPVCDNLPMSMTKNSDCDSFDSMVATDSPMHYDGHPMTTTLTPMHLRKAKLMFFYTRYPSSSVLKIFFPDVRFNKNNTAQLVKWFSNFREFFYIQMEKYGRQALAEGVKNHEDIVVTTDSELYRVLNLHYNRNNQIEVPENFRHVVQSSLREFFKSILVGKDQEQSWKKSIYKVIARLDDPIPEYFKSPNWMEQLNDA